MQFLVKLGHCFNAMFSPVVTVAGRLLWVCTTAESKHSSHQTERDDEKRMSRFPAAKVE